MTRDGNRCNPRGGREGGPWDGDSYCSSSEIRLVRRSTFRGARRCCCSSPCFSGKSSIVAGWARCVMRTDQIQIFKCTPGYELFGLLLIDLLIFCAGGCRDAKIHDGSARTAWDGPHCLAGLLRHPATGGFFEYCKDKTLHDLWQAREAGE